MPLDSDMPEVVEAEHYAPNLILTSLIVAIAGLSAGIAVVIIRKPKR